ncbi:5519_t:CDS:2 [Cetraspora pellucida]|uniref:5519_t:CDS:1 n=1 Tax=Cetraspora pellucida TaxID=1433469 RepID=A0A9N9GAV5_9GLOM|nr:5519_t:CDS:2 [Cetraspora pellucida]
MASTSSANSSSKRMDTTSFGSNNSIPRNKSKCIDQEDITNSYSQLTSKKKQKNIDIRKILRIISNEFKIYDSTLSMIEISEYKTTSNIVSTIEPVLEEFGISRSKLVSIMTDNSSNVKAAVIQLSTKISPPKPNSTYIALKRLTKLERSIRWLVNDLENSTNIEHQHDNSNI